MRRKNIGVMVVDDSTVVRAIISDSINKTPGMEVVGQAGDGVEALQLLTSARPDVMTLDVQMPNMDGLATLDAVLAKYPIPIIMVSSLTKDGARITLDALERGALDYLAKPDYGKKTRAALREELPSKIRSMAKVDVARILRLRRRMDVPRIERPRTPRPADKTNKGVTGSISGSIALADKCIAIGISTGGPPALSRMLQSLSPPMPPIVIVQHMPPGFTKTLAWRLDSATQLTVREAENGDTLRPNNVFLAPGGKHLRVQHGARRATVAIGDGETVSGHRPSADVMMTSVAQAFPRRCLGIIMTGMGRDGVDGCAAIRHSGGFVLGQNEASSDVYGMNKVAFVEGHVDRQFDLKEAAAIVRKFIQTQWVSVPVG